MTKNERVNIGVSLDAEPYILAKEKAGKQNKSFSGYVRTLIEEDLNNDLM